jgi:hypothetical protein
MEGDRKENSSDFKVVADKVFETLLTITTILSGVYVSITFGWFGQAMVEPHPGEPMKPEMVTQAVMGVMLGLIFIVPLVFILLAWAFSKFRNSVTWRTVAWSGLTYCLTQDFVGIVAMFGFPLIAGGAFVGLLLIATGAVVIITPFLVGAVLGYRVSIRYSRSMLTVETNKKRHASIALLTVVLILVIQGLIGLFLLYSVRAL